MSWSAARVARAAARVGSTAAAGSSAAAVGLLARPVAARATSARAEPLSPSVCLSLVVVVAQAETGSLPTWSAREAPVETAEAAVPPGPAQRARPAAAAVRREALTAPAPVGPTGLEM